MKRFASFRNILIAIAFTVFLLFVKDNVDVVWEIICTIAGILTPFVVGFLFAYLLNFPYKFFYTKAFGKMGTKHKIFAKMKKPLALVCTYTLVAAIFVSIILIVFPQLVENLASLVETMPTYYDALMQHVNEFIDWINSVFNAGIEKDNILNNILTEISKIFSMQNITQFAGKTGEAIFGMVLGTASGVYNFVMGIVISVYFLAAKEQLCRIVKRLAVAFIPIKYLPKIYEIVDITDTKCGRFLVGDIIDAAFVGLLTFVAMVILNVPYAPLIAVLIGVTNIIPFFGPFIGAIPSAILLFIINPWDMIKFILIVVVIQQLDGNLFKPKIIGNQVGLSSFWVLFSVILGGALFGLPGFILGTPIFAVIYSLVGKKAKNAINDKGKIAQEALDFEVLNYQKIAEEQKRIREEKENQQREKIKKLIGLNKTDSDKTEDEESDKNENTDKKEEK
ncbi:AI-2E family transporter [Ruminococcus sp.]|uniref:AI-2E family transporter n=1 Tax=Ruminococcus sp. TaxID=41978 RepID=UPI003F0F7FE1